MIEIRRRPFNAIKSISIGLKASLIILVFTLSSFAQAQEPAKAESCDYAFEKDIASGRMDLAMDSLQIGDHALPHYTVPAAKLSGKNYFQQKVLANDIASGPTIFIGMMEMGHSYMVVCSDAGQNDCIGFHAGISQIAKVPSNSPAIFRGTVIKISDPEGSLVTAMSRAIKENPELYSYTCANGICRLFEQIGAPLVGNVIESSVPSALIHRIMKNGDLEWCGEKYPISVVSIGTDLRTINLIPAVSNWLKAYYQTMTASKKVCKARKKQ